jgi:DNA modification methylase
MWGNAEDLWRLWYSLLKDSERLTFRNEIVWDKQHEGNPTLRVCGVTFEQDRSLTQSERCLFFVLGEQGFNNNADNYWEGWDSVRNYLTKEKEKMGWSTADVIKITGKSSASHYFTTSQFMFPTEGHYKSMQKEAKKNAFKKDYNAFKKDYNELKKDFYKTRSYFNSTHSTMTDVWCFNRVTGKERHNHATPKPVEMMERIIKTSSKEKVIEPFLGSGSTLIAAEKLNRKCYGMELDEKYCDVIIERWEQFTGQKAIKNGTK